MRFLQTRARRAVAHLGRQGLPAVDKWMIRAHRAVDGQSLKRVFDWFSGRSTSEYIPGFFPWKYHLDPLG